MNLTMMEKVGERWEKNGRIFFDRPKPTVGCSASGRRRKFISYRRRPKADRKLGEAVTQFYTQLNCTNVWSSLAVLRSPL
jgi:hypothetical protein